MSRALKWILAINIALLAVLSFVYPYLMVGPGKLIAGHQALHADCFACHTAWRGVQSDRCTACHKPLDIGRLAVDGTAITKPLTRSAFHQELNSLDCVACHSDHSGVKRYRVQGRFSHGLLKAAVREQCQACHHAPKDSLHQQISGNCAGCHTQTQWTPATFDHEKHFVLDRDHNTRCVTCHVRNDYKQYTCYGCHEHTPDNVRRKHVEEGIRDFSHCVKCHRSASEHGDGEGD